MNRYNFSLKNSCHPFLKYEMFSSHFAQDMYESICSSFIQSSSIYLVLILQGLKVQLLGAGDLLEYLYKVYFSHLSLLTEFIFEFMTRFMWMLPSLLIIRNLSFVPVIYINLETKIIITLDSLSLDPGMAIFSL